MTDMAIAKAEGAMSDRDIIQSLRAERDALRDALAELLLDAQWLDDELNIERTRNGWDPVDEPTSFAKARAVLEMMGDRND